jgi:hypothetical protein
MRRTLVTLTLVAGIGVIGAATPAAAVPGEGSPASCNGYLSSYANPNMGFIIHELVQPLAEQLGVNVGTLQSTNAGAHNGSIEACIP